MTTLTSCGCGRAAAETDVATDDGERKAVGVDPDIKSRNLTRLRPGLEGQMRGLQKMVEEDRYCARHHS